MNDKNLKGSPGGPGSLRSLKSRVMKSAFKGAASGRDHDPQFKSTRSSTGVFVFLLSVALGGVGVFYSRSYIEGKVDFYRTQIEKPEAMIDVVVPARRLSEGQTIRQSDLLIRSVPVTYADANAVVEANYLEAIDKELAFDIEEGKPLLWAHLEAGRTRTFSGLVPEGARALTVRVDEINSISGFLQPGDRIDLLMTHGLGNNNAVFPLIQNLPVIATGLQTRVQKNSLAGKRVFSTITVNVSPEDAQKVTLAQKLGKLTAVLRNPDDTAPLSAKPMTAMRLLKKPPKPPAPVRKAKPQKKGQAIEYIVGGV